MELILGLLTLLAVWSRTDGGVVRRENAAAADEGEGDATVSEQLEKANNHLDGSRDGIKVIGDIAVSHQVAPRNADPCVLCGCMWPRAADGKVYVPYVIADHYSSRELDVIRRGLDSFSNDTCIRFLPRSDQRDYLHIQALRGCYSFVGRQGRRQTVSLSRQGCIHYGTVQHELLHALGFNHEHCRSDRDQHIRVLLRNVMRGQEYNFMRLVTLNQGTPYDYDSVMHYGRLAFSKDIRSPTMVAEPDAGSTFGSARRMSRNDIARVNLLYCKN